MAGVTLDKVEKVYANGFKAVHGIDLDIKDGEFMVLVGPSGCAKSTTLRMVAGLEEITAGTIRIGDRIVNDVEPKDRDIAMVFQNYALYPHMTVYNNMAWVLRLRKIPKDQIDQRVRQTAEILGLSALLQHKPKQLSGGQMQRVAVGRAIVRSPQVFLFDEPLSNLDAKLRVQMRVEISKLHKKLKNTMIYVTHDQVEAMTMGDRICVMELGRIKQVDTPADLYKYPADTFVAGFIGSPSMNLVTARLCFESNGCYANADHLRLRLPDETGRKVKQFDGRQIVLGIRPEHISSGINNRQATDNLFNSEVLLVENMGNETHIHFAIGANQYVARVEPEIPVRAGERHAMWFDARQVHLFDCETTANLIYPPKTE